MRLARPELVFVVSGPSGVGKNTVVREVCDRGLAVRAVTATSRAPRPGEVDGKDYYFVSRKEFEDWLAEGRLLEHTQYVGNYYGTPAFSVDKACEGGLPVILVSAVDGALQLKARWSELRLVFIAPPTEDELRRRLEGRRDTADSVDERLARAREETALSKRYDWIVVNDRLDDAVEALATVLRDNAGTA